MEKSKVELVFQVGCVVPNVDQVIDNLKAYFHLEEDSIVVKSSKERAAQGIHTENEYNGKPVEFHIKTARLNFGGIDLEYVEPLNKEGGDPYSDWLNTHGPGIHHINMKLEDRSILDKLMAEQKVPRHIWSRTGDLELETFDFRKQFGFIAELGDMVVGPMAEAYSKNKDHGKVR